MMNINIDQHCGATQTPMTQRTLIGKLLMVTALIGMGALGACDESSDELDEDERGDSKHYECALSQPLEEISVGVHRLYNPQRGHHFYTNSNYEADKLDKEAKESGEGWHIEISNYYYLMKEEWVPNVYSDFDPVPLYRCNRDGKGHRYQENDCGAGWNNEGLMGYASLRPFPGSMEILRLANQTNGDHLTTRSRGEYEALDATADWYNDGITLYVFPHDWRPEDALGQPLAEIGNGIHRLNNSQRGHHFFTNSIDEAKKLDEEYKANGEGWKIESTYDFYLLNDGWRNNVYADFDAVGIYRCNPPDAGHRYVEDECPEEWKNEGLMGYAAGNPFPGSVEMLRVSNEDTGDFLITKSRQEYEGLLNNSQHRWVPFGRALYMFPNDWEPEE